ncbi:MAG: 50S ribosomal protein L10 [Parcubacteria group bacterium GW2011_GWC1_43_11b]|uniref:Large ribosomal subunit protein uL10 n=2 Tax=Candidatus Vogeliibacteriota TaxID=1817922 RepID=A0A1G2QDG8_9BACT|nr:MAG: 50S ribosomal protein L10 [Parcubacteria group bacterium GW2011_GWB1_42_9]KKS89614.1 MAG: 50S ribosomal protein L10 [Parcubacteria group bacterium GW2011_GWC1_43_11b]KKT10065.1 MAG: 50S ribosomal protein L10 [Parcubacteria group bacterium GW2011_GWA1_43_21]OHA58052.1 MAG: 50S ribosomal protein L10 [Candidatus Vogelbacteria bacterium RIFOXYB1_FULL_42_16]OHA58321.1 MAG: 50S ribosomal protein L10 [Candidatus Vogelbacteria bacterium RIFOXYD1_FULL_42_15]
MAISKQKKEEIVAKVKEAATKAKTLVFVNFHGLPVATATEMRKSLRERGIGYVVAKKTLIRRALANLSYGGEMPELPGEIALAYAEDQLAPIQEVYAYQKKNSDALKMVGGVFEGNYVDAAYVSLLATIPSREVLLGQFVNIINSPIAGLVMSLDQIRQKKEQSA